MTVEFTPFPKIPRLRRDCVVTEKIDGTNAAVVIRDGELLTQSRNRFITPGDDNYGFAAWCRANHEELLKLGEGIHFGEWWGAGIQRRYGLNHKRFSLFNAARWGEHNPPPACCHVVPVLYRGAFDDARINGVFMLLGSMGSSAAPGFKNPEGIIVYHNASGTMFKRTFEHDEKGKDAA